MPVDIEKTEQSPYSDLVSNVIKAFAQLVQKDAEIERLEEALRTALAYVPDDRKVVRKCINYDPAGSTYEETEAEWFTQALQALGGNDA